MPRENDDSSRDVASPHPPNRYGGKKLPQGWLGDILIGHALKRAKETIKLPRLGNGNAPAAEDERVPPFVCLHKNEELIQLEPVVMKDGDQATDLLLPSIRHVLHKLDKLMAGLRQARITQSTQRDLADELGDDDSEKGNEISARRAGKLHFSTAMATSVVFFGPGFGLLVALFLGGRKSCAQGSCAVDIYGIARLVSGSKIGVMCLVLLR